MSAKPILSALVSIANIKSRLVFTQVSEKHYTVLIRRTGALIVIRRRPDNTWSAEARSLMPDWVKGKSPEQAYSRMIKTINNAVSF